MDRYPIPLRYPGGKARLAGFLRKVIERNSPERKVVLVEPYAGGAGASLSLLFDGVVKRIIINDLDRAIFAFWRTAVHDPDYLIRKVRRTQIDMREWHRQRDIYLDPKADERKLAFAALFLNRTNRSGILGARPVGGLSQDGEWRMDARFPKQTVIRRLTRLKSVRGKIAVSNKDGIQLLKGLGQHRRKNDYFVFLDPPYYEQGGSLYLNYYESDDHEALAKYLAKSSLRWIMTYDDAPVVRDLYSGNHKRRLRISHSAQVHKQGQEIVVYGNSILRVNP